MKQVQKRMHVLGAVSVLGGVVLAGSAAASMDGTEQLVTAVELITMAVVGLAWMWLGARLLRS